VRVRTFGHVRDMVEVVTIDGRYVVHCLHVVAAVHLPTKAFVFKGMSPGGIVTFPMRVKLVELMG